MAPRLMEAKGVAEDRKARDLMCWTKLMNALKVQMEKILFEEIIKQQNDQKGGLKSK